MARKTTWTIKTRDGQVLHEEQSISKKAMIESLVARGESLANADLRNLDLSHLELVGADLRGADLSGASLKGSSVNGARFDNAILSGVRGQGMTARGANFSFARFGVHERRKQTMTAVFDGAEFTHARFDGVTAEQASFERCGMSGVSMCMGQFLRCDFREARLCNAEWSRAAVMHSDFRNAEMNATTAAYRIPRASLPNRTVETIAVGNKFDGAVMDDTTPNLRRDRLFGFVDSHFAWAASTAAMIAAAAYLPLDPSGDWLGQLLGQGVMLVGALTLIGILKEKAVEQVQERLSGITLKAQLTLRATLIDLVQRGANIRETMVAMAKGPGIGVIRRALAATKRDAEKDGILGTIHSLSMGATNMIVCDRKHMALALEWMSTAFSRSRHLKRDVVISRVKHEDSAAPSIIKLFKDGGMAAFWTSGGKVTQTLEWDADDLDPLDWNQDTPARKANGPSAMVVRHAFERAVVRDHMPEVDLNYNSSMQQVKAGQDGSIVITNIKDQLPRNPHGSVLIRVDGTQYDESEARRLLRDEQNADPAPVIGR